MKNKKLYDVNQPIIDVTDRGFLLGDGIFETILFRHGEPNCWQGHMDRLLDGLDVMAIPFKLVSDTLLADCLTLLSKNALMSSIAAVRVTVSRGAGGRGLNIPADQSPMCLIQAVEYVAPTKPIRLAIDHQCRRVSTPLSRFKTLDYTLNVYARSQAQQRGYDDAILLNDKRQLVCTTSANIFLKIDGVLVTPPLSAGAVAGIERSRVLQRCQSAGLPCKVRRISLDEILQVTSGFISNSLVGCQVVQAIDERVLDASLDPVNK